MTFFLTFLVIVGIQVDVVETAEGGAGAETGNGTTELVSVEELK